MIEKSKLNALVIDIKGDRGLIPYPSKLPLAAKAGALKLHTIPDLKALVTTLKAKNLYLIARIVTFKDDLLATAHPEWAIRNPGKAVVEGPRGTGLDRSPPQGGAGTTSIGVAEEAAAAGFDEVQFDYIRFPDAGGGVVFAQATDEESRVAAITDFLREAAAPAGALQRVHRRWMPSAMSAGTRTTPASGQRIEDLATVVDIISPMLYPSGFQFGIPGYRNPVQNPYEIVYKSLEECKRRTAGIAGALPAVAAGIYRLCLRREGISAPTRSASRPRRPRDAGTDGWMLWNPRNVYTTNDIKAEAP